MVLVGILVVRVEKVLGGKLWVGGQKFLGFRTRGEEIVAEIKVIRW